jgi:hypothetical protein
MKSKLVAANAAGDTLSQMSDVLSVDSGVDSEFDIDDFKEEAKGNAGLPGMRKVGRKPAPMIRTQIKSSNDPTKPPLMLGKAVSALDKDAYDPQRLIAESNQKGAML